MTSIATSGKPHAAIRVPAYAAPFLLCVLMAAFMIWAFAFRGPDVLAESAAAREAFRQADYQYTYTDWVMQRAGHNEAARRSFLGKRPSLESYTAHLGR